MEEYPKLSQRTILGIDPGKSDGDKGYVTATVIKSMHRAFDKQIETHLNNAMMTPLINNNSHNKGSLDHHMDAIASQVYDDPKTLTPETVVRALSVADKRGRCDICRTNHRPVVLELADAEIYMCTQCVEDMQERLKTVLVNHLLGIEEDE